MNYEHLLDELVDLGAATVETKGGPIGKEDQDRTFVQALGLSDD